MAGGSEGASKAEPLWRRLWPFALAIALVAIVLFQLNLRAFRDHLASVNAFAFFGFAALFIVALLSADSFATVLVYRRSVAPISFREFWLLRGASYLPSLLNHHVGQAVITVSLARKHGVPIARVAGATLVVYASWMGALVGLLSFAGFTSGQYLAWCAAAIAAGLAYLAVLALRPAFLTRRPLLAPLFEAGVKGHIVAVLARLPHLAVLFVGTWLPFRFFEVDIPLGEALPKIPLLMVAVTLPITPAGLGTRDLVAPRLFEAFARGATHEERLAAIAASTLSWAVAITLLEALLGLLLLRRGFGGRAAPIEPGPP
jgi:hypothetical protein